MHFICNRDLLLEGIQIAQKAVTSRSTLPALEGLLLQTHSNGSLTITGYDLELGIACTLAGDVLEPGSVIFNSRMFGDIIRKMPSEPVDISVDDRLLAHITCGRIHFDIVALDSTEYPELPQVAGERSFDLSQSTLRSMIRQTLFAVSTSDNKPVHTGSMFEVLGGELRVISVDGYRLALRKEPLEGVEDMSFVVPGTTLSELLRILKDDDDAMVHTVLTRKHIVFETGNVMVVSRLLEGDFLNYNNAIPKSGRIFATVDVRALTNCVERASLLINEQMKSPVRMHITDRLLEVNCTSTLGKISDAMDVVSEGGEIEIGFNNRYLLDALKACEVEQVKLELSSPLSPCVLVPTEGDRFLFLVLPVRLKPNEN